MSLMLDSLYSSAVRADNGVEMRKRIRDLRADSVRSDTKSVEFFAGQLDMCDRDLDPDMWERMNERYAAAQARLESSRQRLMEAETSVNDAREYSRSAWERYADVRARIESMRAGK